MDLNANNRGRGGPRSGAPYMPRVGIFPVVHLNRSSLPQLQVRRRAPPRVLVRVAPPTERVLTTQSEPVRLRTSTHVSRRRDVDTDNQTNVATVIAALKEITKEVPCSGNNGLESLRSIPSTAALQPLGGRSPDVPSISGLNSRHLGDVSVAGSVPTRKRMHNDEITSSLSSSRLLLSKRKNSDSLCSTPVPLGKHLKLSDSFVDEPSEGSRCSSRSSHDPYSNADENFQCGKFSRDSSATPNRLRLPGTSSRDLTPVPRSSLTPDRWKPSTPIPTTSHSPPLIIGAKEDLDKDLQRNRIRLKKMLAAFGNSASTSKHGNASSPTCAITSKNQMAMLSTATQVVTSNPTPILSASPTLGAVKSPQRSVTTTSSMQTHTVLNGTGSGFIVPHSPVLSVVVSSSSHALVSGSSTLSKSGGDTMSGAIQSTQSLVTTSGLEKSLAFEKPAATASANTTLRLGGNVLSTGTSQASVQNAESSIPQNVCEITSKTQSAPESYSTANQLLTPAVVSVSQPAVSSPSNLHASGVGNALSSSVFAFGCCSTASGTTSAGSSITFGTGETSMSGRSTAPDFTLKNAATTASALFANSSFTLTNAAMTAPTPASQNFAFGTTVSVASTVGNSPLNVDCSSKSSVPLSNIANVNLPQQSSVQPFMAFGQQPATGTSTSSHSARAGMFAFGNATPATNQDTSLQSTFSFGAAQGPPSSVSSVTQSNVFQSAAATTAHLAVTCSPASAVGVKAMGVQTNTAATNSNRDFSSSLISTPQTFNFGNPSSSTSTSQQGFGFGTSSMPPFGIGNVASSVAKGSLGGFGSTTVPHAATTTSTNIFGFGTNTTTVSSTMFQFGGTSAVAASSSTTSPFAFGNAKPTAVTPPQPFAFGNASSVATGLSNASSSQNQASATNFQIGSSAMSMPNVTSHHPQFSSETASSSAPHLGFGDAPAMGPSSNVFAFGNVQKTQTTTASTGAITGAVAPFGFGSGTTGAAFSSTTVPATSSTAAAPFSFKSGALAKVSFGNENRAPTADTNAPMAQSFGGFTNSSIPQSNAFKFLPSTGAALTTPAASTTQFGFTSATPSFNFSVGASSATGGNATVPAAFNFGNSANTTAFPKPANQPFGVLNSVQPAVTKSADTAFNFVVPQANNNTFAAPTVNFNAAGDGQFGAGQTNSQGIFQFGSTNTASNQANGTFNFAMTTPTFNVGSGSTMPRTHVRSRRHR